MNKWVAGARPRTLPASVAPVILGTAAGYSDGGSIVWWRAALAMVVALALQVGVNYSNDYHDGVRGTDDARVGPMRLVGSGAASPAAVKRAAFLAFFVAAVAGLVLSLAVNPWLLCIGVASIAAAWFYTGGTRPYGYSGLGEVMVLVFFGFVATLGSAYVQHRSLPAVAWWSSLVVGLPAVAILLANNVRDVATDEVAGKRTLAVRIGASRAQQLFAACVVGAFVAVVPIALQFPAAAVAVLAAPIAVVPVRTVLSHRDAPSLIAALGLTARVQLLLAVLTATGIVVSAS
ncbi:MAG: 1,4-dihydroxy-2-naphthoate polyprenyltransferase [Acidimicrobiia bacterium]